MEFGFRNARARARTVAGMKRIEDMARSGQMILRPAPALSPAGAPAVNVLVTGGKITDPTPPAGTGNVSEEGFWPGKFTYRNPRSTSTSDKWEDSEEICLVLPLNDEGANAESLDSSRRYFGRVCGVRNGKAVAVVTAGAAGSFTIREIALTWIEDLCVRIDPNTGYLTDMNVIEATQTRVYVKSNAPGPVDSCVLNPNDCCDSFSADCHQCPGGFLEAPQQLQVVIQGTTRLGVDPEQVLTIPLPNYQMQTDAAGTTHVWTSNFGTIIWPGNTNPACPVLYVNVQYHISCGGAAFIYAFIRVMVSTDPNALPFSASSIGAGFGIEYFDEAGGQPRYTDMGNCAHTRPVDWDSSNPLWKLTGGSNHPGDCGGLIQLSRIHLMEVPPV